MASFPKATTPKAFKQITDSMQELMPIENKLEDYVKLMRKIFNPYSNEPNNLTGKLWSGVATFPTYGDHGFTYGGDTLYENVRKIKKNYTSMQEGTEREKIIALNILNAIKVFPKVVKASEELLPKIKKAEGEADNHKTNMVILPSSYERRNSRYKYLYSLRKNMETIIEYSENKKNQMIIDAIMKPEMMLAFSKIEKGTENPETHVVNPNPLNRDVILKIGQYLGGRKISKCKKSKNKKYLTRKSPAYSASKCAKGTKKKGNDNKIYIVTANKKGVKRWVKFTQKKKSKSKTIKK